MAMQPPSEPTSSVVGDKRCPYLDGFVAGPPPENAKGPLAPFARGRAALPSNMRSPRPLGRLRNSSACFLLLPRGGRIEPIAIYPTTVFTQSLI